MDGNAQCIMCYRSLSRNSFFYKKKNITKLAMDFSITLKGMIGL